ncbi:hypothetical protein BDC45DRAFT_502602 [Circinella umbellata]|nr:hypothetical protein BDC45DRAFT_502602 [Circinella umbellata]
MEQTASMDFTTFPAHLSKNDTDKRRWEDLGDFYNPQISKSHKDGSEESVTNSEDSIMSRASPADKSEGNQSQRRKEQNRAAQRAFRERKERYVKELEDKIRDMQEAHTQSSERLQKENNELRETLKRMETEMYTLKGAAMAFEVSMNKLREAGIEVPSINELSPPASDRYSSTSSTCDILSPMSSHDHLIHINQQQPQSHHHQQQTRSNSVCDEEMREHEEFAESTNERFEHKPDPITLTDAKMIPGDQVWDYLSTHPRFDELDIASMCAEIKRRSVCSGSGPVIEEKKLQLLVQEQLGERV